MIAVLYDGWPLLYQPESMEAIHLLTLLAYLPSQVEAILALPGTPPAGLPDRITAQVIPMPDTPRARLVWEQITLPRAAKKFRAQLIHLTASRPPLFSTLPALVSPADLGALAGLTGFYPRLRDALAKGGMSRLRGLIWPDDLAALLPPDSAAPVYQLPVAITPSLADNHLTHPRPSVGLDLPDTYLLYHASTATPDLRHLLNTWSWAAGPVGDYYPLVVLGLSSEISARCHLLLEKYQLGETVRLLPHLEPTVLASVYRNCSALLHTGRAAPWEGPLRLALACGKPVIAEDHPTVDAIVGAAAYLAPPGDARALGAAIITVLLEENISENLSKAAIQRAAAWRPGDFAERLFDVYRSIMREG